MTTRFEKIGLWGRLGEAGVADLALEIVSQLRKLGLKVFVPAQSDIPKGFGDTHRLPPDQLAAEGGSHRGRRWGWDHASRRAGRSPTPCTPVGR